MNDFAFIITCYKQTDLVAQQIDFIRNKYRVFNRSKIIVVTTSETPDEFDQVVNNQYNIQLIKFKDAPGGPYSTFKTLVNPSGDYISWRHQWLPPRILLSIEKALYSANTNNVRYAIHLHSDSFITPEKEDLLLKEYNLLKQGKIAIICDVSQDEDSCRTLPKNMHWCPEGIMLNIEKCKQINYGFGFSNIFDPNSKYKSHNYGCPEALLATNFHYCISGKNITSYNDIVSPSFLKFVKVREYRTHHGCFGFITNLSGEQPDALKK